MNCEPSSHFAEMNILLIALTTLCLIVLSEAYVVPQNIICPGGTQPCGGKGGNWNQCCKPTPQYQYPCKQYYYYCPTGCAPNRPRYIICNNYRHPYYGYYGKPICIGGGGGKVPCQPQPYYPGGQQQVIVGQQPIYPAPGKGVGSSL